MPQVHNHDVADLFREMADLLHIRGGEPHRVRAFQRVAQIVEALPQPVDKMIRFGTLQRTPNIGDGSVHRIKQILRTGTCDDLSRLRAQVPAGLRDLLSLKGLGPSSVRQLHQQLGIADLDQLELAAKDGRLRQLPRFGIDAVHGLLREIEVRRANRGKVPLVVALRAFEEIATRLRDVDGAVTVVPGGSCRRRREMIGDLDVLVESANPKPLIEAFMTLPSAREVLMRREDGGSIRLATLQQADLRVFAPETWGAGLHHFTGSKEHNVALRTRAGRLGLHISENGISDRATDRRLSLARTEEEIYAAVGMPYIPPELREHRGEIEAALDGRLPRLITAEDLRGDLHMHSTDSDGEADARTMALTAAKLGFEYLAITDHSQTLEVAGGLDERRVLAQGEKLRKVESELDRIHVLWGIEVDILADGTLDL
ncbi:MAG: PHP domain-containing protein, partial [Acidobacteriota bacterium]